jgi:hypothetical protein
MFISFSFDLTGRSATSGWAETYQAFISPLKLTTNNLPLTTDHSYEIGQNTS